MDVELKNSIISKLKSQIEGFEFEVGILDSGEQHYWAQPPKIGGQDNLTTYAGMTIAKQYNATDGKTVAQVFIDVQTKAGIDLLGTPFNKKGSEIVEFMHSFLSLAFKRPGMNIKRVENLLQAVVRNPIMKGDYGQNTPMTVASKGFNHLFIETSQMFQAIKAKVKRV